MRTPAVVGFIHVRLVRRSLSSGLFAIVWFIRACHMGCRDHSLCLDHWRATRGSSGSFALVWFIRVLGFIHFSLVNSGEPRGTSCFVCFVRGVCHVLLRLFSEFRRDTDVVGFIRFPFASFGRAPAVVLFIRVLSFFRAPPVSRRVQSR